MGKREENQDASFILEGGPVWTFAMADGMGGYSFGRETAVMALEAIKRELEALEQKSIEYLYFLLMKKYEQINTYIYDLAKSKSIKMGTTISMINFMEQKLIVSNAGDTGIYRIRGKNIETLSKLHNVAAENYEKGRIGFGQYKRHGQRNVLTQCIGLEKKIHPFFSIDNVMQGDIYIICTDGIHNFIDEDYLVHRLIFDGNIQRCFMDDMCKSVIGKALENGSEDNLSIIIVRIDQVSL